MALGQALSRDKQLIFLLVVITMFSIAATWLGGQKLERQLLIRNATNQAVHWANYLERNMSDLDRVLNEGRLTSRDEDLLATALDAGNMFRYKIFDANGVIVLASRPRDLGMTNTKSYFLEIVRHGGTYTKLEEDESFGANHEVVSEAYVPFVSSGQFRGAIEVYVDTTGLANELRGEVGIAQWGFTGLLLVLGALYGLATAHNIRDRNRDYNTLAAANVALANAESDVHMLNEDIDRGVAALELKNQQLNLAIEGTTKLNAELAKANSELEIRVDDRTAELQRVNEQILRMTERFFGSERRVDGTKEDRVLEGTIDDRVLEEEEGSLGSVATGRR